MRTTVCYPTWMSYALEQPEMLRSHDYKHKRYVSRSRTT